jgi:hypothetical protein
MLTKEIVIDKIEILETGVIQVREAHRILEDGVRIAETYHRGVLEPGADLKDQPAVVAKHATAAWDKATLDNWAAKKAELPGQILAKGNPK